MLSNVVDTQIATHALYGGVVPGSPRLPPWAIVRVTEQALADAGIWISMKGGCGRGDCAPGLISALLVSANFEEDQPRSR